ARLSVRQRTDSAGSALRDRSLVVPGLYSLQPTGDPFDLTFVHATPTADHATHRRGLAYIKDLSQCLGCFLSCPFDLLSRRKHYRISPNDVVLYPSLKVVVGIELMMPPSAIDDDVACDSAVW